MRINVTDSRPPSRSAPFRTTFLSIPANGSLLAFSRLCIDHSPDECQGIAASLTEVLVSSYALSLMYVPFGFIEGSLAFEQSNVMITPYVSTRK